jgi:hypothetical protein
VVDGMNDLSRAIVIDDPEQPGLAMRAREATRFANSRVF